MGELVAGPFAGALARSRASALSHLAPQRCDEIPDDVIEVLVLRGLLTATTSTTFSLHGQVGACGACRGLAAFGSGRGLRGRSAGQ